MWDATVEPFVRLLLVLLALLLAAWGVSQWLKQRATTPARGQLRVITAVAVGHRERLVLVEVEGERLLVGVTPQAITPLWHPRPFADHLVERSLPPQGMTPPVSTEPNDAFRS